MVDVFKNPTMQVPKSDRQIIRVDMETQEIGGRKSSLPSQGKTDDLGIRHVPNADGK
jgi:hypothetical protein